MTSAAQPVDGNFKPISPSVWDPTTAQFVVQQSGTVTTGTDTNATVYAPAVVSLSPQNTGLPVNIPTIVQKASAKSTASVATLAVVFAQNNTLGNTIIVVCGVGNGTAPTVADSAGNTYTAAVRSANSTTFETAIFYAVNAIAGANTVTVTNAGATASIAAEIYEAKGLLAQVTGVVDNVNVATGTSGTAATTNVQSSTANCLAFAGVGVGTAAQTVTVGAGWTSDSGQLNPTTPAGLYSFVSMSQFLGSTMAVTPQATFTSEPWTVAVAIFRPVVVGVQGTFSIAGYNYTRIATATTTLIKTGVGVLHSLTVNTPVGSGVIELDDALTNTAPIIAKVTFPATILSIGFVNYIYDAMFTTGLSITTTGTMDITVMWK